MDKPLNLAIGVRLRDSGVLGSEMVRQSTTDGVASHMSYRITAGRLGSTYTLED
jgi:hypothetical protein